MARAKKSQIAQTTVVETILVSDAVAELNTTEQSFRLALADIRTDDFDTCEAITKLDFEAVAKALQPKALPAMEEQPEVIEETTKEPVDQQPEQTEENTNLPAVQDQKLPTQQPPQQQPKALSLQEMLVKSASEEIQILDAIQQAKNQVIFSNYLARRSELTELINQDSQANKVGHLGVLQQLPAMVRPKAEFTPDEIDVTTEINNILGELTELTSPGV